MAIWDKKLLAIWYWYRCKNNTTIEHLQTGVYPGNTPTERERRLGARQDMTLRDYAQGAYRMRGIGREEEEVEEVDCIGRGGSWWSTIRLRHFWAQHIAAPPKPTVSDSCTSIEQFLGQSSPNVAPNPARFQAPRSFQKWWRRTSFVPLSISSL